MARVKITKGKPDFTKRNVKYYWNWGIMYLSLVLSVVAILKAYDVIN